MINWKDKQGWAESLFYVLCALMFVMFLLRKEVAGAIWVMIALQNFRRANSIHREYMAAMEKWIKDLRSLGELAERGKK